MILRGENEAKVVTDGAEDDVGGIAGATFESPKPPKNDSRSVG